MENQFEMILETSTKALIENKKELKEMKGIQRLANVLYKEDKDINSVAQLRLINFRIEQLELEVFFLEELVEMMTTGVIKETPKI